MKKIIVVIVLLAVVGVAAWRLWPKSTVSPERIAEFTDPTITSELGDDLGQIRLECIRGFDSWEWQSAVDACDKLIRKDPHNALTHYVKAAALFRLNTPDGAVKELETGNSCPTAYLYNRRYCLDNLEIGRIPELEFVQAVAQWQATKGTELEPEQAVVAMGEWLEAGRKVSHAEPRCFVCFASGLRLQRIAINGKAVKLRELGRAADADQVLAVDSRLENLAVKQKTLGESLIAALGDRVRGPTLNEEVRTYGFAKSFEQPTISELIAELDRIWQGRG